MLLLLNHVFVLALLQLEHWEILSTVYQRGKYKFQNFMETSSLSVMRQDYKTESYGATFKS